VLAPDLLTILVCSQCKGDLAYDAGAGTLTCAACRLRYRIEDGIPNMLVDEAEKL
jgi:LSD1 subclass zinc finger protein